MMQIVEVKDESTTSNIVSKYIDVMQIEINSSQRYKRAYYLGHKKRV